MFTELPWIYHDIYHECEAGFLYDLLFIYCYLIYSSQHSCKILVPAFILIDEETD